MPTRRVRDRDERGRDKKFHATFPATFLSCNLPSETETKKRERETSLSAGETKTMTKFHSKQVSYKRVDGFRSKPSPYPRTIPTRFNRLNPREPCGLGNKHGCQLNLWRMDVLKSKENIFNINLLDFPTCHLNSCNFGQHRKLIFVFLGKQSQEFLKNLGGI